MQIQKIIHKCSKKDRRAQQQFFDLYADRLFAVAKRYAISTESAEIGGFLIEIIKALRNLKSKLQLPLNKEVSRVVLSSKKENLAILTNFAEDIKNTIRINEFDVIDEETLKESKILPDSEEYIENLNVRLYIFK